MHNEVSALLLVVSPSSATASSTSPSAATTASSIASAPTTTATPTESNKLRQLGVDNLLGFGQNGH